MDPLLPRRPSAALILLAAACGPAWAMFEPEPATSLGASLGLDVRGAAALEDGSLVVLDVGQPCRKCTGAEGKEACPHPGQPRLVHLQRKSAGAGAKDSWQAGAICGLPPTVAGILGIQGGAVYLNERVAGVVRLPLVRQRGTLRAGEIGLALGIEDLLALGIPFGCAPSLALAPDGGLVLGFDGAVALLPPGGGRSGPKSLRWLLGKAPAKPLPPGARPAMVPTVAADGTIYVLDHGSRAVFRFAAGDRKMTVLAKGASWPTVKFMPVLAAAHGDTLLVGGQDLGLGKAALMALAPGQSPGTWPVQPLDLPLGLDESIRFTPQGDLLMTRTRLGGLRLLRRSPALSAGGTAHSTDAAAPGTRGAAAETKAGAGVETKARPAFTLPSSAAALEAKDPTYDPADDGKADEGPILRPVDKSDRLAIAKATCAFAESKAFDQAFAQWARRPGGAGATPDAAGLSPVMGPFSLGHGGLKQVVRWMLRNADEANHPADMADWLEAGKPPRPRFSFGLYRHARHAGVVLELYEVLERAARIAEDAGDPRVAGELEPAGGSTGYRLDRKGVPRYYQGLTVTLGPDHQSLVAIHPGGAPGLAPPDPDRETPETTGIP